jgi:hypothetical protein
LNFVAAPDELGHPFLGEPERDAKLVAACLEVSDELVVIGEERPQVAVWRKAGRDPLADVLATERIPPGGEAGAEARPGRQCLGLDAVAPRPARRDDEHASPGARHDRSAAVLLASGGCLEGDHVQDAGCEVEGVVVRAAVAPRDRPGELLQLRAIGVGVDEVGEVAHVVCLGEAAHGRERRVGPTRGGGRAEVQAQLREAVPFGQHRLDKAPKGGLRLLAPKGLVAVDRSERC